MTSTLPDFLMTEDRRALEVFTTMLPGPYYLLVHALDGDTNQGYCLVPGAAELAHTPLRELRYLKVGWWATLNEAQTGQAQLQSWLDQHAALPWHAPTQQTEHGLALSIDPGNPLAGYQDRRWSTACAHNTAVPAHAVAVGVGRMVGTLTATSLQSGVQAQRLADQTQAHPPALQQLEPADRATFELLLQERFQNWHGQWGAADLCLVDRPEHKVTCEAVAYLSPCLAFGLVSAFRADTTLVFCLTLRDHNHGATLAGHWDHDPQANLMEFRPAGLFAMNLTTFGGGLQTS